MIYFTIIQFNAALSWSSLLYLPPRAVSFPRNLDFFRSYFHSIQRLSSLSFSPPFFLSFSSSSYVFLLLPFFSSRFSYFVCELGFIISLPQLFWTKNFLPQTWIWGQVGSFSRVTSSGKTRRTWQICIISWDTTSAASGKCRVSAKPLSVTKYYAKHMNI